MPCLNASKIRATQPPSTAAQPPGRSQPLTTLAIFISAAFIIPDSPAAAQRPLGIDVSHYNGTITLSGWQQAYASGRVFAFTKADEGATNTYNDATLVSNMTNGRTAGLLMGCYHFGRPESNTAVAEADHFVAVAANYVTGGYLRPVLDIETGGSSTTNGKTYLSNWINDWINRVQQLTGVEAMVYTSTNYATNYLNSSVASRTLWVANWPSNPNPQTGNPATGVWSTWTFWQYSDAGSVPGISGAVDLDVFHYTLAQLQNYVIPTGPLPTINRSPATLSPSGVAGLNAGSQSFTVANSGGGTLSFSIIDDAGWMTLSPTSETSTGPTDIKTITVTYTTSGLAIGTYNGTITIADSNATNTPQTLAVTLTVQPVPGDFNADGHVNDADALIFASCMTGANLGPPAAGCEAADLDDDNDVDISDFGRFQLCINGNLPADPTCAN